MGNLGNPGNLGLKAQMYATKEMGGTKNERNKERTIHSWEHVRSTYAELAMRLHIPYPVGFLSGKTVV
ncbi:hypothetical protein ACRALDRAFT_205367 [Sodiomyces alcalophilus JCM 7366]|uniref:uncharacterized protein n=1 Tax=Sodiomyces alcalophilus JCM 7366 TaxID=591952 RepID=UPI0039B4D13A